MALARYTQVEKERMRRARELVGKHGDALASAWLDSLDGAFSSLSSSEELLERGFSIMYDGGAARRSVAAWMETAAESSYGAMRIASALDERAESPLTLDFTKRLFSVGIDASRFASFFRPTLEAFWNGISPEDLDKQTVYDPSFLAPVVSGFALSRGLELDLHGFAGLAGETDFDGTVSEYARVTLEKAAPMISQDIGICLLDRLTIPPEIQV